MNKQLQWLRLVVPLALLAACTSATEPRVRAPEDAKKVVGFYCTADQPECIPEGYVDLDTYPMVDTTKIDPDDAVMGQIAIGPSALTDDTPPPACTSTRVEDPWPMYGQPNKYYVDRPASCPTGPCYASYLDARDAYRMMLAGVVGGGIVTAVTFLSPQGSWAIRIIRAGGTFVGTSGFVGWANKSRYETARWKLNDCVGMNNQFYHVTIIQ